MTDDALEAGLRRALYAGAIMHLPATDATHALAARALAAVARGFGSLERARAASSDGLLADLGRARALLADDPASLRDARDVLAQAGFDPAAYALDRVRLRVVAPGAHQRPEAAPAFAAHRDTWYANPRAQINWWIALEDAPEDTTFEFFAAHFGRAVANTSAAFDYAAHARAGGFGRTGPNAPDASYPEALDTLDGRTAVRFAARAGAPVVFSAAHLHRTRPNRSARARLSIDFRAVHLGDHARGAGAPDPDNRSRGSALVDYARPDDDGPSRP